MLSVFLFCWALSVAVGQISDQDVNDFDEMFEGRSTHTMYEFIYHDNQHLLLVIHSDICFYVYMDPATDYRVLVDHHDKAQVYIATLVNHYQSNRNIRRSSLEDMLSTYHDLLANFHCQGKDIYTVRLTDNDVNQILYH